MGLTNLKFFKKLGEGEPRRKLDASLVLKNQLTKNQKAFLEEWFNNGHNQMEAYIAVTPKEKLEGRSKTTYRTMAHQLMSSTKIQNYLRDFSMKSAMQPGTDNPIITVTEVIQSLADIIKGADSKDSDKIKASELVLKHLNAFNDHNSSRSTKILTYINNQSTDDLINEINLLQEELIKDGKLLSTPTEQNKYADYEDVEDEDE
jgi:hypothetical protein